MSHITSPSVLRAYLSTIDAKPLKAFSQNFLIDGNIARKIIQTASILPGESVFEIGPGAGALTELLLEKGAQVTAVEKDRKLSMLLKSRFPELCLYEGDILEFTLEHLQAQRYKVVANLPYHLTSPILDRLLPRYDLFSELFLMVQKEVAMRLVAPGGTRLVSPLSLFAQFYSHPKIAFHVPRSCFYPAPKVDSSIIHFTLHKRMLSFEKQKLFLFMRTAFQKRRKMLTSSLGKHFDPSAIEKALQAQGLIKEARPEMLTLDHWIALFTYLNTTHN